MSTDHRPAASTVEIREADATSAPDIAAIHVRSWVATYGRTPTERGSEGDIAHRAQIWERRLGDREGKARVALGVSDDVVVGFVYYGLSPDLDHDPDTTGQVHSVHVDPGSTGQGIGRRLLQHAVDSFRDAGYELATLWVVAGNHRSRRFYERLGWLPDGSRRWEDLAVEGEEGERVEVVRYALDIGPKVRETR